MLAPVAAQEPQDPVRIFAALWTSQASGADRDAAADTLILQCQRPDLARQTGAFLSAAGTPTDARIRLLGAVARAWEPPGRLYKSVLALAADADSAVAAAAMPALGAYRSKEAIQDLLHFLEPPAGEPQRRAALGALVQTTGRDDLGGALGAWTEWFDSHKRESPAQWHDLLAEGVWHRAMRLAAERPVMAERLTDAYRRVYLSLPAADGRPRLITQLLASTQPELRDLAFELISRELSAGNPVDPSIPETVGSLLDSQESAVRARAASLLLQLAPPDGGPRLAKALGKETDAAPAAEMLRAVARWPCVEAREPLLRWVRAKEPVPNAAEAALALLDAGLLTSPDDQGIVLGAARRTIRRTPTLAICRILVLLGDQPDIDGVMDLLSAPEAATRSAAAQALADRPGAVEALTAAAASDPALYPQAVAAVATCRSTADGYRQIERLAAPSPEARTNALLRIAGALGASDLLAVASDRGTDPQFGASILTRLTEHGPRPDAGDQDPRAIFAGIMLLAQFRLTLGRPDLALDALDALPASPPGVDPAEPLRRRTIALLWTNHLEQAALLDAPAGAWLDGLEAAIAEPHARSIARQIRARFDSSLSPEQAQRLAALEMRAAPEASGDPPAHGGDPDPR